MALKRIKDEGMAKRRFYRCVSCGFIQEGAKEDQVRCDGCGDYEWELDSEEDDSEEAKDNG